eukprot:TRINITY_DN1650_c0_g2_i1.p1 TRINITY_DN1650_c0_g2~~TRINITY_DN1650_c0_g2_i1.p1  ORF type:complete len:641 (-),score=187.94 TRINITY_DN1650_c0_g2_i1:127-2049(-)
MEHRDSISESSDEEFNLEFRRDIAQNAVDYDPDSIFSLIQKNDMEVTKIQTMDDNDGDRVIVIRGPKRRLMVKNGGSGDHFMIDQPKRFTDLLAAVENRWADCNNDRYVLMTRVDNMKILRESKEVVLIPSPTVIQMLFHSEKFLKEQMFAMKDELVQLQDLYSKQLQETMREVKLQMFSELESHQHTTLKAFKDNLSDVQKFQEKSAENIAKSFDYQHETADNHASHLVEHVTSSANSIKQQLLDQDALQAEIADLKQQLSLAKERIIELEDNVTDTSNLLQNEKDNFESFRAESQANEESNKQQIEQLEQRIAEQSQIIEDRNAKAVCLRKELESQRKERDELSENLQQSIDKLTKDIQIRRETAALMVKYFMPSFPKSVSKVLRMAVMKQDEEPLSVENNRWTEVLRQEATDGRVVEVAALMERLRCPRQLCLSLDGSQRTPLAIACRNGHPALATFLLALCPEAAEKTNKSNWTPLHFVCRYCPQALSLIQMLVSVCPQSRLVRNNNGWTPLHLAVNNSANIEAIRALIDPNMEVLVMSNKDGWTPLHLAMTSGTSLEIIELLGAHKEVFQNTNNSGWTPLHLAAIGGLSTEILEYLVASFPGAMSIESTSHKTPLDVAANAKVESFLKSKTRSFL